MTIVAVAPVLAVIARPARQAVVPGPAVQRVAALVPGHPVVPRPADQRDGYANAAIVRRSSASVRLTSTNALDGFAHCTGCASIAVQPGPAVIVAPGVRDLDERLRSRRDSRVSSTDHRNPGRAAARPRVTLVRVPPSARSRDPRRWLFAAAPEPVADGVLLIRGGLTRTMNVYLLDDPGGGLVAYDAGEKSMARAILTAARGRLTRVVLGHGDTDHRGAAPALRAAGIPVFCHPDARPYAEGAGGREYWRPQLLPPAVRALHGVMHHVWDGGPVTIDGTVRAGDVIAGFEVVELPGHAPGLIGLWRERDRVALVSDAFYMTDMWGRPQEPALPLDAYNHDTERARESLRALAALEPRVVLPGHLGPLTDAAARLRAAL